MKKNVRKALAISGMTLAIGASGLILDASANSGRPIRVQRSHQEKILKSKGSGFELRSQKGRRSFSGIVKEVSENSITFVHGEKTFTAKISGETRILDKKWNSIPFKDIRSGDKIKVFGKSSEDIIAARTVRVIFNQ